MALRRYSRAPILGMGEKYGTSYLIPIIREAIKNGEVQTEELVLQGSERLDTLAGKYYGDGTLWWVLAIASNIGYALQVPTGTKILIPRLSDITKFI